MSETTVPEKETSDHRQHADDEIARHRSIAASRERSVIADYIEKQARDLPQKEHELLLRIAKEVKERRHL